MTRATLFGLIGWLALAFASPLVAQPFTYQGFLRQGGQPVNGTTSLTFRLYDAPTGGNQLGSAITQNVNVQNGLFTVVLDFGNVWTGGDRYLEIQVGSTTLSPRVKITPAPYASFAQRPWHTAGSNIFYNDGNVGIGTNSPAARLSLGGGNANTKLAIWEGAGAADLMGLGVGPAQFRLHLHNATNRFSFLNAPTGSEIVTILGNGNVGIGTSSPAETLHVNGNIRLADNSSIFGVGYLWGSNHLRLYGDASGGPDIFISSNGNVGIGLIIPTERLHVNGNIRLADDSSILGLDRLVGFNDLRLFGDASGGPDLFISPGGNVGIGTNSPSARLHVNGGDAHFANNNTTLQILPGNLFGQSQANAATLEIPGDGVIGVWDDLTVTGTLRAYGNLNVGGNYFSLGGGTDPTWRRVEATVDVPPSGGYAGAVRTFGPNGSVNVYASWLTGRPNHGVVMVCNAAGSAQAGMFVDEGGYGVLYSDDKYFRVPDPDDPTRDIWYGCIEGPELAMYVRGTARLVNGRARIELPDHFRKLADEQGMTVQLTPLSPDSKGLCVVRKGLDGIEVAELLNGRGNYEFDWRVEAVRKEHRDFQVYRPWDEVLPGGTDPAEAWEARLKSIQERQARQQSRTNTKEVQR